MTPYSLLKLQNDSSCQRFLSILRMNLEQLWIICNILGHSTINILPLLGHQMYKRYFHLLLVQYNVGDALCGPDMLVGSHILNDLETAEKWST
ncbi:hypothetical protein CUMW_231380 [Citrus unshiu]|uniref:Uncharacterized protein n=1 Tax=Citrus unshiu TaxID=55188 RepID=A0A2H5QHP8_CITUN|nr:hypothetical protein CUMW_231380 [Citrus unshiu]